MENKTNSNKIEAKQLCSDVLSLLGFSQDKAEIAADGLVNSLAESLHQEMEIDGNIYQVKMIKLAENDNERPRGSNIVTKYGRKCAYYKKKVLYLSMTESESFLMLHYYDLYQRIDDSKREFVENEKREKITVSDIKARIMKAE